MAESQDWEDRMKTFCSVLLYPRSPQPASPASPEDLPPSWEFLPKTLESATCNVYVFHTTAEWTRIIRLKPYSPLQAADIIKVKIDRPDRKG
jgi:hypothetical protein